jgi:hypothetical protein
LTVATFNVDEEACCGGAAQYRGRPAVMRNLNLAVPTDDVPKTLGRPAHATIFAHRGQSGVSSEVCRQARLAALFPRMSASSRQRRRAMTSVHILGSGGGRPSGVRETACDVEPFSPRTPRTR